MNRLKYCLLLLVGCVCFTSVHADSVFQKDQLLVDALKAKNIRLIVMRQAESLSNAQHIIDSKNDIKQFLTFQGIEQAADTAKNLFLERVSAIYTSPLFASLETSNIIAGALLILPFQIHSDPLLTMQNFGVDEGATFTHYQSLFPSSTAMYEGQVSGGESGTSVFNRTHQFLEKMLKLHESLTVLIITHAFNYCHIKMCLTGDFGQLPAESEFIIYDFNAP